MKIALAADHAGLEFKNKIKAILTKMGHEVIDLGTDSKDSVDYPDFGLKAAHLVADGKAERGVTVCWTGNGMNIAVNKVKGIRSGLALNQDMAYLTRFHNDANMLALSQKFTPESDLESILKTFLETPFEGGRHQRRIQKIHEAEGEMREKNLVLLRPPKRRILRDGIPLNETENARFWSFAKEIEIDGIIETFLSHSGLYLRGRCDGPHRSGTEPCGYVFISECSFDNGHAPLLYFDPFPRGRPLKISFRKWKGILPFSENDWSNLDGPDRLQRGMRVLKLDSMDKEERGVSLAIKARRTFSNVFDLSISLTEEQLQ